MNTIRGGSRFPDWTIIDGDAVFNPTLQSNVSWAPFGDMVVIYLARDDTSSIDPGTRELAD